jgi:2-phospho-L-lactate/phosphoenolpyruvate guanylyltransferase
VLAIIPVNSPFSAKRRLDPLLSRDQRSDLVLAMLADVVDACRAAGSIDEILVVSPNPAVAPEGTAIMVDQGNGHAAAVAQALASCSADGALVVMADCPLVRPAILDVLCEAAQPVALCPAQDGGTNALALRPPDAVEPAFGAAGGARIVVERAQASGFDAVVVEDELVALDIDTPEDVERLLELGAGTHTHNLLDRVLAASARSRARAR